MDANVPNTNGVGHAQQQHPAQANVGRFHLDLWSLLCPTGNVAGTWACAVKTTLARASIEVREVGSLQEAEGLHGLLILPNANPISCHT